MNEPTSALDPELVGEVLNVIGRLAEEHDLTMLLVTHEMRFAREISDRVCFFDQGQIREEGTPEELFSDPNEDRPREFIKAVAKDRVWGDWANAQPLIFEHRAHNRSFSRCSRCRLGGLDKEPQDRRLHHPKDEADAPANLRRKL